jgi:hypothetical protein
MWKAENRIVTFLVILVLLYVFICTLMNLELIK